MKSNTIEILRCPSCKGKLDLTDEVESKGDITKGTITCRVCKNKYSIEESIPRMYITDNEIIEPSSDSEFSEFIVNEQNLEKWMNSSKTRFNSQLFTNGSNTMFMVAIGWILLISAVFLLILSWRGLHFMIVNNIPLSIILFMLSMGFFAIDYSRYRIIAKVKYSKDIRNLRKLFNESKLSEYDIRISKKDREYASNKEFDTAKDFTTCKGMMIASLLNRHSFSVKTALNVGCGGDEHKSVSKPYFDKGYNMIGVDVSEEYLKEFVQIFNADGILANAMALPFESESFDLVNFTDILEHLHNPLQGLKEIWRVLRMNGVVVLSTNNRCAVVKSCVNPFVVAERIVGLYYDDILPHRNVLAHWLDFVFYHTEFSKREITELIKAAGFKISSFETAFFSQDLQKIGNIFQRIPVLKLMREHFVIIAKREADGESLARDRIRKTGNLSHKSD
jgi:SAM-dependent methyltransferase/uncharacterized protein YbaR (Trm112 family)